MATAKPKVKRMMLGGMAAGAARGMGVKLNSASTQSQMQAAARSQQQFPRSTPRGVVPRQLTPAHLKEQSQLDALRAANPYRAPGGGLKSLAPAKFAAMQKAPPAYGKNPAPAGASRSGMLKKGGAVKKATKK